MKISDLEPGTICLSGGNTFIQRAIKFFTRSKYSHSFVVISGPYNIPSSIETTESRVCVRSMVLKVLEPDYIVAFKPTKALESEIELSSIKTFLEGSGLYYGYKSYIYFVFEWLKILFHKPLSKIMPKWFRGGITCTELSAFWIKTLNRNYELLFDLDLNLMTPERLRAIMISNPQLFEYLGEVRKL